MASMKQKIGDAFEVSLELTEDEWADLWPWISIEADVAQNKIKHNTNIIVDEVEHIITIRADTTNWILGPAKMDILVTKENEKRMIPSSTVFKFSVVESITKGDTP